MTYEQYQEISESIKQLLGCARIILVVTSMILGIMIGGMITKSVDE